MTPWTALLESLHSSLIDELTERYPNPKPELGMPLRQAQRAKPDASVSAMLGCAIIVGQFASTTCIAVDEGFVRNTGLTPQQIWDAILKRAGAEFSRRGLKPRLGTFFEMRDGSPLPNGMSEPTRMIWIPFKLKGGVCFLGMGV